MSRANKWGPRGLGGAVLMSLAGALGCQSIADIPDVSFSPLCKQYCDLMFDSCAGPTREQYDEPRTCLEVCVALEKNAKGSTLNMHANTVQCRIEFAKAARRSQSVSDAEEFCSYAGPGGGDACTAQQSAPDCESYCALFDYACGSKISNLYDGVMGASDFSVDNIGTQAECVAKCRAIPRAWLAKLRNPVKSLTKTGMCPQIL